jgi:hypothetical protein
MGIQAHFRFLQCWHKNGEMEGTTNAGLPHCGQIENARHVWLCPEPAVFFVWALLMSSFSDWLTSLHTAT